MKTHIFYLDNLRTFAIFLVIVLHAGLVYEPVLKNTWIVWDTAQSNGIGMIRLYIDIFVMALLFFISGYFIPASLKDRTARVFLAAKAKRILLPWVVAVLTLIPMYKVLFLASRGLPPEAWYTYFHFFERQGSDLSVFSNNPTQNWLWFLPILFIFQVAYLVLSRSRLLRIRISIRWAVALILILGVLYSMTISMLGLKGWEHNILVDFQRERLLVYFMVFLLGSLCYKTQALSSSNRKTYILANIALTFSLGIFTVVALNLFFNLIEPGRNYYFISETMDKAIFYFTEIISMLSMIYVLIHAFRSWSGKPSALVRSWNQNSYGVYIIHVIVLGLLAMALLKLKLPALVKFPLLALGTFLTSNLMVFLYRRSVASRPKLKIAGLTMLFAGTIALLLIGGPGNIRRSSASDIAVGALPEIGLHEAVITANMDAVVRHIRSGSDLDIREPNGGGTPLMTAATFGMTDIAAALLEAGANPDLRNNEGSTPLHAAAFFGRKAIVKMLLDTGADWTIPNNAGSTALTSVEAPFEAVKGIYDHFLKTLGPLGLELDYSELKANRQAIAAILKDRSQGKESKGSMTEGD